MVWTDLTAMIYVVPLIITVFVLLLGGSFFGLASIADIHCPVCNKKFGDVFALRRHIKCSEETRTREIPKAA